jgi:hypothetical protein
MKNKQKNSMRRQLVQFGIFLTGLTTLSLAHSSDLIAFGKECLAKEERLKAAKDELDALSLSTHRTQGQTHHARNDVDLYQEEKAELEAIIADCAATDPNSAYCHQIRYQYNEINYLIQRAKEESIKEIEDVDHAYIEYDLVRIDFNEQHEAFIAYCRNSDAHYALLQSPTAYAAVCSNENAKRSITCSLF